MRQRNDEIDLRLQPWPKVREIDNGYSLSTRILTPLRFGLMRYAVLEPLLIVWRWIVFFLLIDAGLLVIGQTNLFAALPYERQTVYAIMFGLYLVWTLEILSNYKMGKLIFGKHFSIAVDDECLIFGGRFRKKRIRLTFPVTFQLSEIKESENAIYQKSQAVRLSIDDARKISVLEVFPQMDAQKLENNANMMLHLAGHSHAFDLDIDPTRR